MKGRDDAIKDWLTTLVGLDTQNPGGDELACAKWLEQALAVHKPDVLHLAQVPRPGGRTPTAYVYARFGTPQVLLNVHFDTVPAAAGWTSPPHALREKDGFLWGLGTADTKGAIACILWALQCQSPKNLAVLFSGDEEKTSLAMHAFLASEHALGHPLAIVCEPSSNRLGHAHRGMVVLEAECGGPGGHSSRADATEAPLAALAAAAGALRAHALEARQRGPGLCLNIAALTGSCDFNIIPSQVKLVVSARPAPNVAAHEVYESMARIVKTHAPTSHVQCTLSQPAFATHDMAQIQTALGRPGDAGEPLNYWTEAALLAQKNINAVVCGPGNISVAHAADECVAVTELAAAAEMFERVLGYAAT